MATRPRLISLLVLGLLTAIGATATATADAGMITLTGTPGAWTVEFPDSVALFWDTANKTNNTQGTLNEITNRTNNDPITLTFRQTVASTGDSAASGGLRVNFQKDDSNIVGPDWYQYQLRLIDDVPGRAVAFTDHPPQPHFHPTSLIATTPATFSVGQATFSGDDINKYASTFKGQADGKNRDYPDTLTFDGRIRRGESMGIRNLLLHERLFGPEAAFNKRTFRLVETVAVVPEPSTFLLFGIGLVAAVACRARAWRGVDR